MNLEIHLLRQKKQQVQLQGKFHINVSIMAWHGMACLCTCQIYQVSDNLKVKNYPK